MMVNELSGAICIGNQVISTTIWVGWRVEGFYHEDFILATVY